MNLVRYIVFTNKRLFKCSVRQITLESLSDNKFKIINTYKTEISNVREYELDEYIQNIDTIKATGYINIFRYKLFKTLEETEKYLCEFFQAELRLTKYHLYELENLVDEFNSKYLIDEE